MAPNVRAVLGPTNTGKTHLAIERLLAHDSGIVGFPLRLLARENYDRMVASKGARNVALITGEEKIIPPGARWFACTVEAMPLDRKVAFLAVDEIQLCADPDRGHVFTDRLLHARGFAETMFLGAETIRPLLQRLVPQAVIETRPRLSSLTHAGPAKLTRLPPRSAIVAFSAAEVYALAELIRRRRGGCAVVMGRLSPRTRNAQVALYQAKEVDFLVATDAIGMGLNMDVDHVAFAALGKFDGHRPRRLTPAEIAQVAGRAGRGMRDGSFGTTGTCRALSPELAEAVEQHRFDPIERVFWRNADLDFSSRDALAASLEAPPFRPGLARGSDAADLLTLLALGRDPDTVARATGRTQVRLLWEVCQVPDFRKLADDSHTQLCARIFRHLVDDGRLPAEWIGTQIAALDRPEGDIDMLMQRLSAIRVWSYVAAHADWVPGAIGFQGQAREVEDRLSDSLHEMLTARFVDRRSTLLLRRLEASESATLLSAVTARGEVIVEGHPVGDIAGFIFHPDAAAAGMDRQLVLRAARRALGVEMPRRVAALAAEPDGAFSLSPEGRILWHGAAVARLRPGPSLLRPRVQPLASEFLDGAQREQVRRRLQTYLDDHIGAEMAGLPGRQVEATLRGPLHLLAAHGGVAPPIALAPAQRVALRRIGARAGRFALYLPALLKPRPMALRALLWAIHTGNRPPSLPAAGRIAIAPPPDWPEGCAAALGWHAAGPMLLRLDIAERMAAELEWLARRRPVALPSGLAARLGVRGEHLPAVLRGLGLRLLPVATLPAEMLGPPAPPLLALEAARTRRPPPPAQTTPPPASGPFAALAVLRR